MLVAGHFAAICVDGMDGGSRSSTFEAVVLDSGILSWPMQPSWKVTMLSYV